MRRLVAGARRREPGAGGLYWAMRSRSLLEWQATATAVLGVHAAGLAAPVDRLAVSVGGGDAFGVSLPPGAGAETGAQARLIALAGGRLRRRADALLGDLETAIPVKRRLAERLLADRAMGLLALLCLKRPDLPAEAAEAAGRRWLAAMDLDGASGLAILRLGDGRDQPSLDRRSCCLDYRAGGVATCASCPRRPRAERMRLMRESWEAHARAV
jgi:siderophore ferric iron reductase